MKQTYIYIVTLLLAFVSCDTDEGVDSKSVATLGLGLTRAGATSSQPVDADLAVTVLDANGEVYVKYPAGSVPNKLILEPGTFTVIAYTENQDTWAQENEGKGAACYYGSQQVTLGYDEIAFLNMRVPLTNYAVTLTLPDLFHDLFKSHALQLISGNRQVAIHEKEKAYFAKEDGGFSYKLEATNTDNVSHATRLIMYKTVEEGKLYNITYYYGTDANSGGLDIEITDDMQTEDNYVPLNVQ